MVYTVGNIYIPWVTYHIPWVTRGIYRGYATYTVCNTMFGGHMMLPTVYITYTRYTPTVYNVLPTVYTHGTCYIPWATYRG